MEDSFLEGRLKGGLYFIKFVLLVATIKPRSDNEDPAGNFNIGADARRNRSYWRWQVSTVDTVVTMKRALRCSPSLASASWPVVGGRTFLSFDWTDLEVFQSKVHLRKAFL
jgi:hypothetical protein